MFPIEENFEANRIQISIRTNEGVKNSRGESGNLLKKEISEEVIDTYEDESNKNAFYIQSFNCSAQKDNLKETGHFKQMTESDSAHRPSLARSGSRHYPNLRYDNDSSIKEEPVVSIPTISSPSSNQQDKSITFESIDNKNDDRKTQPSKRPQIPKDPKKDNKIDGHWIKKSQLQKKQKAHQLSINLRKGSPIKTQVNLFTSESSSKDSVYESINIADVSKKIKAGQ